MREKNYQSFIEYRNHEFHQVVSKREVLDLLEFLFLLKYILNLFLSYFDSCIVLWFLALGLTVNRIYFATWIGSRFWISRCSNSPFGRIGCVAKLTPSQVGGSWTVFHSSQCKGADFQTPHRDPCSSYRAITPQDYELWKIPGGWLSSPSDCVYRDF